MWKKILFLFSFLVVYSLFAQNPEIQNLEKEINVLNKKGQYNQSQQKIINFLNRSGLSNKDESKLYVLLAETYRSLNDYPTCIDYLLQAQNSATYFSPSDPLIAEINSQLAFVYFDSNQYKKAGQIMKNIEKSNYANLSKTDKAYIIMQEGYLSFLEKDYVAAEKKYKESTHLIYQESACDVPVILVKEMQLFGAQNKLVEAENVYKRAIDISDSCGILKYKVYATEELGRIFTFHGVNDKAVYYNKVLDSLNYKFDRDNSVSKLHNENLKYIELAKQKEERNNLIRSVLYVVSSILFLFLVYYFYKKSSFHKKEVANLDARLNQMISEIKAYSEYQVKHRLDMEAEFQNFEKLNERQKELLILMTQGLSNKDIAEKLYITEATVKYHIKNIYDILELKNRKEFFTKISKKQ